MSVTHAVHQPEASAAPSELPEAPTLQGYDHLEWWVGNARQSAHYWVTAFGFRIDAYAGPETGVTDRQSYVVSQGELRFVLTNALDETSEIARFVSHHGEGITNVAYLVDDAVDAHARLVARGGHSTMAPTTRSDDDGSAVVGAIAAHGSTQHSVVERRDYRGPFLPGYEYVDLTTVGTASVGLSHIDHVVTNVEFGALDHWVQWYVDVFGFAPMQHFSEDAIATEYSALRSTVVSDGRRVVQPINEPAEGRRKSQIQEFLDYYGGPGIQHIAMHTTDIVGAVGAMVDRGVRFMTVPDAYYEEAPARLGAIAEPLPWADLQRLGILVDRDENGYLLQIFTEPVAGRPTVFMEIIEREGARGFGEGNFKALFTSIEAEQARRGNL